MTTQDRKVAVGQALVKTASIDAEYVKDADGNKVRIGPGETVKAGPPEVEVQGTQSWTWVHIEQGDKKGYIEERFLDDADADIAKLPAVVIFEEEVSRTQFAEACFTHALIADANTAFLYALAFAESGGSWTADKVKNPPESAGSIGVFRYSQEYWDAALVKNEALTDIEPEEIKFPEAQAIVAARLTANAITHVKKNQGRGAVAIDLYLAHLFCEDGSHGHTTANLVLEAEKANAGDPVKTSLEKGFAGKDAKLGALKTVRPTLFANGDATTVAEFLKACEESLDAGYEEALKLSGDIAEKLKKQIPESPRSPVFSSAFSGKTIILTDEDIDALARVAHSEVAGFRRYGMAMLQGGLEAVVDTIFNRVAHKNFPDSISGVVNQRKQFSAINPLGHWSKLPPANDTNFDLVKAHVIARAQGKASVLQGATHFLNPHTSSPTALNRWGKHLVKNAIASYGKDADRNIHYHGFDPGGRAPAEYAVEYKGDTHVFAGDGTSLPPAVAAVSTSAQVIPDDWKPVADMKRIICHWTVGRYEASNFERGHYHILVEGDGTLVRGKHSIKANEKLFGNSYAMHTKKKNTGSIGVSVCCMGGAREKPFKPGSFPMNKVQWDAMVVAVADLCKTYNIAVSPQTVLGHGEVQANLGVPQDGKWDPMKQPWNLGASSEEVGNMLRAQVSALL